MNFDVQSLRWYIAVAEELHFARAAKTLNIARTRLSAAVIELETELGYSLFVPGASPTELTDRGTEFLQTARVMVAEEDEALRAEASNEQSATLTVGFTEGVTPTKWTRIWSERFPDIGLELIPTTADTQESSLRSGAVDVGFVRLPVDRNDLSVIGLYEEVAVVVVPKDHPVAAFDRIAVTDLADEHLLQEPSEVPEWASIATEIADGTRLAPPQVNSHAELVEYVAAGLGIAVLPQSIARLHSRKDLVYRPIDGVAGSPIAIAWLIDKTTEEVEDFVGIVRGRSVRSSRGTPTPPTSAANRNNSAAKKKQQLAAKASQPAKGARGSKKNFSSGKRPRRP